MTSFVLFKGDNIEFAQYETMGTLSGKMRELLDAITSKVDNKYTVIYYMKHVLTDRVEYQLVYTIEGDESEYSVQAYTNDCGSIGYDRAGNSWYRL